jgi:glutaconate CoA-transferase, subunit B
LRSEGLTTTPRRLRVRNRYGEPGIETEFTVIDDARHEAYLAAGGIEIDPESATAAEWMVIATARAIPDGAFLFVGTGLPIAGCMMAQHTYAPNAVVVMESGVVGPKIEHLPVSVGDARASFHCTTIGSISDLFGSVATRGYATVGILGGAECDRYANLNSLSVNSCDPAGGPPRKLRLAGSGGANSIASLADVVIVMMPHERRRFPERCAHLTSPAGSRGRLGSCEERSRVGLYRGGSALIAPDICVLRTETEGTGELLMEALYDEREEEEVYRNTGWVLGKSPTFHMMDPPTLEELKILRCIVDPTRIYLGRSRKR